MSDDDLTRVQLGRTGPVRVAHFWLDAVLRRGDLRLAWLATHRDLRQRFADAWVNANRNYVALAGRDRSHLIECLGAVQSDDPLWPHFAATTLGECVATWEHVDIDRCGWGSVPRAVGPTRELLYLIDTNHADVVLDVDGYAVAGREGAEVPVSGEGFVMEYTAPEDTDGVDLLFGDEQNLWRVIDFERESAS